MRTHIVMAAAGALCAVGMTVPATTAAAAQPSVSWQIAEIAGVEAVDPDTARLSVDATGRVSATVGCNIIAGGARIDGADLRLGPMMSTRRACPPPLDAIEQKLAAALEVTRSDAITGGDVRLTDGDGAPTVYLTAFEGVDTSDNGPWRIAFIKGADGYDVAETQFAIEADGRMMASVGCNGMSTTVRFDGNGLRFGQTMATLMGCPPGITEAETRLGAALAETRSYRVGGDGIELLDATGDVLLRLIPAP